MTEPSPTFCRGRVYDSIVETVGATPLVRMRGLMARAGLRADLLAKLEFFNPLGSAKDRIGSAMIDDALARGAITPDTVLIEPTSGNTGIALAFACAARGFRLILTMPESMSPERRKMLALLGVRLELTPASKGMRGAIARAEELAAGLPDAAILQQFSNPANPEAQRPVGEEIWADTRGAVDVLVAGVGTGGTITGAGRVLKAKNPAIRIVAVEPEDSPVLSGGAPGPHGIQGIGAGFVPEVLDVSLLDEVVQVATATALSTARDAARLDGVPVGISSGAALFAGIEIARRPESAGKTIVAIVPSFAERYLSTPLFDGL